jgi:hypothetical protein
MVRRLIGPDERCGVDIQPVSTLAPTEEPTGEPTQERALICGVSTSRRRFEV